MESIKKLVEQLGSDDQTAVYKAKRALLVFTAAAGAPGKDADRSAAISALSAELGGKHSPKVKQEVCQLLGSLSWNTDSPALAKAADDLEVREAARWALDRAVGEALTTALARSAVDGIGGEFRVGAINALAKRPSRNAVAALLSCVTDDDLDVRLAAADALAEHADPNHDAILAPMSAKGQGQGMGAAHARIRVLRARIRLAGNLARAGNKAAAAKVYQALLDEKIDGPQRKAAELGLKNLA